MSWIFSNDEVSEEVSMSYVIPCTLYIDMLLIIMLYLISHHIP
jgi:hypothetical protein